MLCCPTTTRIKGYPFEVPIAGERPAVVLADQVKSLDWRALGARKMGVVSGPEIAAVIARLKPLLTP